MLASVAKNIIVCGRIRDAKTLIARSVCSTRCRRNISNNILTNPMQVEIPRLSIPEFVFSRSENFADFVQFECPVTKRSYTYKEVRNRCRNLSKMLRKKLGLNKGDTVLIFLPNVPEFQIVTLGCMEASIVVTTANSLYTSDEIARQINDSGTKLIVTCYELFNTAASACQKVQKSLPIVVIKTQQGQSLPRGAIDFEELSTTVLDVPALEPPDPDELAILPYSSGTTGLPKGVRLTHSNIVSNLIQGFAASQDMIQAASGDYQEITPGVLPMFHIYGFTITTLLMMLKGVKVLTLAKFSPDIYIQTLKDYKINFAFVAPPLVLFLTLHPDVKPEYLQHLNFLFSGAAPLGALDEEKFLEKVERDIFILQGYGLTETSPTLTMTTKAIKQQYPKESQGSIGWVLPKTEAKIVKPGDASDTPLGAGESGELLIKGPQVMQSYHNNPKATEEIFSDGWFRTGDLAYYNEHGFLYITDRIKELIKVKGFQVAPAELEEILRDHPQVVDAAVIGIPDMIAGELPRAYIQTKSPVNTEEINQFVNDKVAKYKRLDGGIEFVNEIPKNPSGKIMRRQLKERYLQEQNA